MESIKGTSIVKTKREKDSALSTQRITQWSWAHLGDRIELTNKHLSFITTRIIRMGIGRTRSPMDLTLSAWIRLL